MSFKLFSTTSLASLFVLFFFFSNSNGALISQSEYPPVVNAGDIAAQKDFTKYEWAKAIVNIYYRFPKNTPAPPGVTPAPTPVPVTIVSCEFINETINVNETVLSLNVTYSNGTIEVLTGQNTTIAGCPGFPTPYHVKSVVFFPKVDYFAALKVADSKFFILDIMYLM